MCASFVALVMEGHGVNHLQIAQINLPYTGENEKKKVRNTNFEVHMEWICCKRNSE
jgi:hypothetical protein